MTDTTTAADRTAANLRAAMARRRISGLELGRRTGMSRSQIQRRVTGEQPLDVIELEAFARVLETTVEDLIRGSGAAS